MTADTDMFTLYVGYECVHICISSHLLICISSHLLYLRYMHVMDVCISVSAVIYLSVSAFIYYIYGICMLWIDVCISVSAFIYYIYGICMLWIYAYLYQQSSAIFTVYACYGCMHICISSHLLYLRYLYAMDV